ncbi:MAG: YihY/virulence factor BrkB family protein [Steroidobacteraceae bacterium]
MWPRIWKFFDRWLFGEPTHGKHLYAGVLRFLRYPYAIVRDLLHGDINLRAMGLVYATLLSTIPLVAFTFAILKGFGAHRDLEPVIYEFFRPLGANAATLTERVMAFADSVSSGLVGSIGFALLLWTLIGTIKKVEDSFNFVWRVEVPRSFARRIAEYIGLLIIGPVTLVAFLGLSHAALQSATAQFLAQLPLTERLFRIGIALAPYVMVTAIFTVLYMFVPNTRVRWGPALIGALAAGVLWAAVGKLFTALVLASTRLMIVYAGFAIIVAALVWTYFGWLILLAGAQLAFYIQNPNYLRLGLEDLRLSSVELERLALKVMYLVAQSHKVGRATWTSNLLATELGLPGIAVSSVVHTLEHAQLLTTTDAEFLLPAKDIGHIALQEILDAARNEHAGHVTTRDLKVPAVDRLGAQLDAAWRACCAERTLQDLIDEPA